MHTSLELAEWEAYERHYGPIGQGYSQDTLAEIHELLQHIYHVTCAANAQSGESPDTKPVHYPRPSELWDVAQRQHRAQEGES